MVNLIVWEFADGAVIITTTEKEPAMIKDYEAGGFDFDEADRRVIVDDAVELEASVSIR